MPLGIFANILPLAELITFQSKEAARLREKVEQLASELSHEQGLLVGWHRCNLCAWHRMGDQLFSLVAEYETDCVAISLKRERTVTEPCEPMALKQFLDEFRVMSRVEQDAIISLLKMNRKPSDAIRHGLHPIQGSNSERREGGGNSMKNAGCSMQG